MQFVNVSKFKNYFKISNHKISFFKCFPKYNMVKFAEGIQKYIQEKNSISTFKLKLKNVLTIKAFDNITIFLENAQF